MSRVAIPHARRIVAGAAIAGALFISNGGVALAHECVNISKLEQNPGAGAQVVIGENDDIVFATNGVMNRIQKGLIDPETGDGFHGIIGFDGNGDGAVSRAELTEMAHQFYRSDDPGDPGNHLYGPLVG